MGTNKKSATKKDVKAEEKVVVKEVAQEVKPHQEKTAPIKNDAKKVVDKPTEKKVEAKEPAKKTTKSTTKSTVKTADVKTEKVVEEKKDTVASEVKQTKTTAKKSTTAKKTTASKSSKAKADDTAKKVVEEKPVEVVEKVDNKAEAKPEIKEEVKVAEKQNEVKVEEPQQTENVAPYKKKILFVASEAAPFIRTGGLGDVAGALPATLNTLGTDTRVILPLYLDIPADFKNSMRYIGSVYVNLAWRYQYCGLFSLNYNNVTYYFIDNEYYFKRNGIYGHFDDAERFAFFSKACLEALRLIDFYPDVIHANDWHTALTPVFLDCFYRGIPEYQNIKTVFTIHNIEFQGKYGTDLISDILGLPEDKHNLVTYAKCANFMKGAIETSNAVTTVSPSYANEIMDRYYSYGLDNILRQRGYKLSGIVNGIDTELYNPATDKALFRNYDFSTIEDKKINKRELLKMFDMEYNDSTPLIGMVTRLTEQKGVDLLVARLDQLMQSNVQMIILGKGDWKYENKLQEIANRYYGKLKVIINFSTDIANKIYAGSDMFLMPSKFEPCGLSQLIAMRYGTIPIVRRTGGLNDTVTGFNPQELTGNGFTFYSYNADDMLDAIYRAIGTYQNKREWISLIANAMEKDFSWKASSEKYIELYNRI